MSFATDLRLAFPPPHPAGRPFILGCLGLLVIGLFIGRWLSVLGVGLGLFCLYFFRDPTRVPPGRPGVIVAPADGRVVSVGPASPRENWDWGPRHDGACQSSCRCLTSM